MSKVRKINKVQVVVENPVKTVTDLKVGQKYKWLCGNEHFPDVPPEKWVGVCKSIEMYDNGDIEAVIDFKEGILLLAVTEEYINEIVEVEDIQTWRKV